MLSSSVSSPWAGIMLWRALKLTTLSPSLSMPQDSVEYPYGLDYEWYAVDLAGHIAVFHTSGDGLVPEYALKLCETQDLLSECISQLPVRGWTTMLVSMPGSEPDFCAKFSDRGIFVYEWAATYSPRIHHSRVSEPFSRPIYELYSGPTSPIGIAELPEQIQLLLREQPACPMLFNSSPFVNVRPLFPCVEREE